MVVGISGSLQNVCSYTTLRTSTRLLYVRRHTGLCELNLPLRLAVRPQVGAQPDPAVDSLTACAGAGAAVRRRGRQAGRRPRCAGIRGHRCGRRRCGSARHRVVARLHARSVSALAPRDGGRALSILGHQRQRSPLQLAAAASAPIEIRPDAERPPSARWVTKWAKS